MNNIQAIFLDLDGTLLNSRNEVSYFNISTINKAIEKGTDVYITSGRPLFFIKEIQSQINKEIKCVAFNGALTDDTVPLIKRRIEKSELNAILEILIKYDVDKYYIKGEEVIYAKDNDERFLYVDLQKKHHLRIVSDFSLERRKEINEEIFKLLIIDKDKEKLVNVEKEISCFANVTSSHAGSIDVIAKGVDKAASIKEIAKENKYDFETLMAIGDSLNDLEMLKVCNYSVAMGNSDVVVKKQAYFVTETNDNDGVGKAIEKFVLR